jgi:hypothetical protein
VLKRTRWCKSLWILKVWSSSATNRLIQAIDAKLTGLVKSRWGTEGKFSGSGGRASRARHNYLVD